MKHLSLKLLILLTAVLACSLAHAQLIPYANVYAHGDRFTLDSNGGGQFITGYLELPQYADADSTHCLAVDAFGNAVSAIPPVSITMPVKGSMNCEGCLLYTSVGLLQSSSALSFDGADLNLWGDGKAFVIYSTDYSVVTALYVDGTYPYLFMGSNAGGFQLSMNPFTGAAWFNGPLTIGNPDTTTRGHGYTLSGIDGFAGQVMSTDGEGNTKWADFISSSSDGFNVATAPNTLLRYPVDSGRAFNVGLYLDMTAYNNAAGIVMMHINFCDSEGNCDYTNLIPVGASNGNITATGIYLFPNVTVFEQAGRAISISMTVTGSGVGTLQYDYSARITAQ